MVRMALLKESCGQGLLCPRKRTSPAPNPFFPPLRNFLVVSWNPPHPSPAIFSRFLFCFVFKSKSWFHPRPPNHTGVGCSKPLPVTSFSSMKTAGQIQRNVQPYGWAWVNVSVSNASRIELCPRSSTYWLSLRLSPCQQMFGDLSDWAWWWWPGLVWEYK